MIRDKKYALQTENRFCNAHGIMTNKKRNTGLTMTFMIYPVFHFPESVVHMW